MGSLAAAQAAGEVAARLRAVPLEASADAAETAPDAAPSGAGRTAIERRSLGQIAWMRLRRDKVAMGGGIFIIFLILMAIIGLPRLRFVS